MMKYIWMVFLVCLLSLNVACGDDKASGGTPSDAADATSNQDASPDEDGDDNGNNEYDATTTDTRPDAGGDAQEPQGTECQDRSACSTNEECLDGQCAPHWLCIGRDRGTSVDNTTCWAEWDQCRNTDETWVKAFKLTCSVRRTDGLRTCSCVVNDVETSTFETDRVECDYDTFHRLANENCGWLVPKIR